MKTFLALFLAVFCFTSIHCAYTPDFHDCGDLFHINRVIFEDGVPTAGQNATAHICGRPDNYYVFLMKKIYVNAEPLFAYEIAIETRRTDWRTDTCFDIAFEIPSGVPQKFPVKFSWDGVSAPQVGCVLVNLELASSGHKFLNF